MSDYSTHSLGVMCARCREVLADDECCDGQPHGYGYQQPNEWSAQTWPDHECFKEYR